VTIFDVFGSGGDLAGEVELGMETVHRWRIRGP